MSKRERSSDRNLLCGEEKKKKADCTGIYWERARQMSVQFFN